MKRIIVPLIERDGALRPDIDTGYDDMRTHVTKGGRPIPDDYCEIRVNSNWSVPE